MSASLVQPVWQHSSVAQQRRASVAVIIATVVGLMAVLGLLWASGSASSETASPADSSLSTSTAGLAPATPTTDLTTIGVDQLPSQAVDTLQLITTGGPFPFSRDGVVFNNRERLLPAQPKGFYREYTVITPGASDRGARRIVAADDGARFYTDDHYDSFREVVDR